MKKHFKWIAAVLLVACIFSFMGCPKEPEVLIDTTAPANVTNLAVTAADGNAVLTWTNPDDDDFAGVQVAMSPAEGTLANAVSLGKDVTSLNVSGLEIGSEYTFTVKTFDTSLNYSTGATEKATVADTADYEAPANVTNLKVVAADGNAVLTWTNPSDADFAGVQVAMSPAEGTLANAVSLGKDVTSLNVSGLEIGSEYTFTVKTFDTSLNYSTGATEKATVADTADYEAPANVTNLKVVAADGNAVLTWTNPSDADFAGVQVAMSPAEGTLANAVSLGKDVTSLNVSGLEIGSEYTFTVKTYDTSLNYSVGAEVTATVADTADYVAPANVTNLVATNKDASVLLTWIDATDEDVFGYEVTWNKSTPINRSAAMEANSMMVAPGAKGCYISNLTNGTEYTFTVKSVDTSGNKSTGETVTITPSIIEKSPLEITLTQSTTSKTNQDVVISVEATTDNASEVKKIAYKEGIFADIDEVLSGTNITSSKEITATENATYTVVATDTAGRRELAFITVSNIDKEAPAQVGNIVASYSRNSKRIDLSWTNPADEDFAGTIVTYGKTDSEEVITIELAKDKTSVVIENIADDDSEYTISIKTKDDVENIGTAKTVTVIAATGAKVTNISLDRTHLDSIMANREIKVTVSGSNFDLLKSLLVQVTDGTTNQPPVEAVIDAENNTATATVTAPIPSSPTDSGTTYTVKAIINSITPAETTATFVVSKPADVTKITLGESQIKVGSAETIDVTITGKNFDIRGVTQVKLFDAENAEVTASTVTVPREANTSTTEFTVEIPVPTVDSVYTVAVFFDDVKDDATTELQVYGVPEITSVTIPNAGESYAGNTLPVTIIGKNFTAPGISATSFSGSGAGISNFVVVSDTKATAEVYTPYVVGTTEVTVNCDIASGTGTLKVSAAEKCFNVGDIILTDGSKVSVADVSKYTIDESNKPIGVIVSAPYGGAAGKAVGLKKSSSSLKWAPSGTTGYNTNFEGIQAKSGSTSSGYTFTGDLDGSDNWAYICSVDPEGTQDAATNYPAFNFALSYAETAGLTDTDYETGWYIPSLVELYEVYTNKEVVEASLTAVGGFTIGTSYYWSSSQYASYYSNAYRVSFSIGYVYDDRKGDKSYVLVLQAFNAE